MSQRKVVCERAVAYFLENYNCAQSVLLAMFEHWNGKNDLIPKIATAFGGGMGRCGSVCGALTGGMMALGIKFGTNEPSMEKRTETYELARKLFRRFEEENGSVLCKNSSDTTCLIPNSCKRHVKETCLRKSAPFSYRKQLRLCWSLPRIETSR